MCTCNIYYMLLVYVNDIYYFIYNFRCSLCSLFSLCSQCSLCSLGVIGGHLGIGIFDTTLLDIQIVATEFLVNWYRATRELLNQAGIELPSFDVILMPKKYIKNIIYVLFWRVFAFLDHRYIQKFSCSRVCNNVRNYSPDLQPFLVVFWQRPDLIQLIQFLETPLRVQP